MRADHGRHPRQVECVLQEIDNAELRTGLVTHMVLIDKLRTWFLLIFVGAAHEAQVK